MKLCVAVLLLLAATVAVAQTNSSADEKAIRDIDKQWAAAAQKKNLEGAVAPYAESGSLLAPGAPIATGAKQIRDTWQHFLSDPNIESVNFGPTKVEVSKSGDMAYDTGWTEIKTKSGTDKGKYVVVWRKVGGKWKAVADIFNSDK